MNSRKPLTKQITTFTLFGFPTGSRYWAFQQMGLAKRRFNDITGLTFYKLLGAGKGSGFSLQPDFCRYGLLATWKDTPSATKFFEEAEVFKEYTYRSNEVWTVVLSPISAHGAWSGVNPFQGSETTTEQHSGPVAILTRASIRWTKLIPFWRNVPETSRALESAEGLLASIGVGEWPVVRQATVSFWKNMDYMYQFAYKNERHKAVIKKTRAGEWYKEELFARFIVIDSWGAWKGKNPLKQEG